jgi:hypothetical protein
VRSAAGLGREVGPGNAILRCDQPRGQGKLNSPDQRRRNAHLLARFQLPLLESAWPELFLLGAFDWSLGSANCPLAERPHSQFLPARLVHSLQALYGQFRRMELDQTELACLRAILIFRPGKPHLGRGSYYVIMLWVF